MYTELLKSLSLSDFVSSVQEYLSGFGLNSAFILIIVVFAMVGGIDLFFGDKYGYGSKFKEGLEIFGSIAIVFVGMVAMAPLLKMLIGPILTNLFSMVGISPAMFPTMFFGSDMGGYPLAQQLADGDRSITNYSGLIQGAILGCTVTFTIPVGLTFVSGKKRKAFSLGILVGLLTMPLGMLLGGLLMNVSDNPIGIQTILINMIPMLIIAVFIILGLLFSLEAMAKGFEKFGAVVEKIAMVCFVISIFQYQTGIKIPFFRKMVEYDTVGKSIPFENGLNVLVIVCITLTGALPMVEFIRRHGQKLFRRIGQKIDMDENGIAGVIAMSASCMPAFMLMEDMSERSVYILAAFAVPASAAIGEFAGAIAAFDSTMLSPAIVSKLIAGVIAILLACALSPKLLKDEKGVANEADCVYK